MKRTKGFIVVYRDGQPCSWSFGLSKQQSIFQFRSGGLGNWAWKVHYSNGYRCVRCTLTVNPAPHAKGKR